MNTGIFITVRTDSSRLPKKALKEVMGKPIISYLISRTKYLNKDEGKIIICTTTNEEDYELDKVAKNLGVLSFHGDTENIIKRHLQCADANSIDFIVNVDGDDILCNPEYMNRVIKLAYKEDFYDVIKTNGLPFGTNCMGYKKSVLETILSKVGINEIDTGWGSLVLDDSLFKIKEIYAMDCEKLDCRLSLDYEEDFLLFRTIIESLIKNDEYIAQQTIIEYLTEYPEIMNINSHINQEYWNNFNNKAISKLDAYGEV